MEQFTYMASNKIMINQILLNEANAASNNGVYYGYTFTTFKYRNSQGDCSWVA